jgi:hypothetical protein
VASPSVFKLCAISYSISYTAASYTIKMPQKILPEAFFKRTSNNAAIEKKKDVVNEKQVLKELQLKIKKNYARALALWDQ